VNERIMTVESLGRWWHGCSCDVERASLSNPWELLPMRLIQVWLCFPLAETVW
jgi:hypothetical protein